MPYCKACTDFVSWCSFLFIYIMLIVVGWAAELDSTRCQMLFANSLPIVCQAAFCGFHTFGVSPCLLGALCSRSIGPPKHWNTLQLHCLSRLRLRLDLKAKRDLPEKKALQIANTAAGNTARIDVQGLCESQAIRDLLALCIFMASNVSCRLDVASPACNTGCPMSGGCQYELQSLGSLTVAVSQHTRGNLT